MAGHSKWSKIKRDKGVNDAKRGKLFTQLGNQIAVAAKSGGDPGFNPSLAMAIEKAKAANMPNSNIDKSIKRGTGESGGDIIEEITFEGYGPAGIGIIVETASDNRNRVTTFIKTAFNKNGGNMAESGSVAFQFTRKGVIIVKSKAEDQDEDLLEILDAGAADAIFEDGEATVYTEMKELAKVRDALKELKFEVVEADLQYVPNTLIDVSDQAIVDKFMKIMDAIEDVDDVVNTYTNFNPTV